MAKMLALLIVFLLSAPVFGQELPGILPPQSAAAVSDITALELNPAGLAFAPGFGLLYAHRNLKTLAGDDIYAVNLGGFGFQVADLNHFPLFKGTQTRTAFALPLGNLAAGGRFSKINAKGSPYDAAGFWDLGLMFRASRRLSLGAVAKNLNRPVILGERTRQRYTAAVAYRPLGERLTLGFDFEQSQKEKFDRGFYRVTADFEVKPGFRLFGNFDRTQSFGFGMNIGLGNLGFRGHGAYDKKGEYSSGINSMYLSSRPLGNLHPPKNQGVVLKLSGEFPEEPAAGFFAPKKTGFLELLQGLSEARRDPKVKGMVLKIGPTDFGFARLQEVANEIKAFRASGRKVIAYLEETGDASYFLAAHCDVIAMAPVAALEANGLKSERTFFKGTLDKLGIKAEFLQHGKYKSAAEVLTRTEMSDPAREEANAILDELFGQFTQAVAAGRNLPADSVKRLIDSSPLISDAARASGLIDTALYPDQLEDYARSVFGRKLYWTSLKPFINPAPSVPPWRPYPEIAVVSATGGIAEGPSGSDFLFGKTMGAATMEKALKKAREDKNVKAIVLRIDSPGGTVQGSDLIWRAVGQAAAKKPLVVSMGDVAASGGYYITTPLKENVLASPGTITGSIGVLGGKFDLSGLYQKIGFSKEVLTRGKNADLGGASRPFTPEQKEKVQEQIDRAYAHFIQIVAEGRQKPGEKIDEIAQGRVWTGSQAARLGLVDGEGGLLDAIRIARQKAGLKPGEKIRLGSYPESKFRINFSAEEMMRSGRTAGLVDRQKLLSGAAYQDYFFAPQTLERANRPLLNPALLAGRPELFYSWAASQEPLSARPNLLAALARPLRKSWQGLTGWLSPDGEKL
jgi:protease-4